MSLCPSKAVHGQHAYAGKYIDGFSGEHIWQDGRCYCTASPIDWSNRVCYTPLLLGVWGRQRQCLAQNSDKQSSQAACAHLTCLQWYLCFSCCNQLVHVCDLLFSSQIVFALRCGSYILSQPWQFVYSSFCLPIMILVPLGPTLLNSPACRWMSSVRFARLSSCVKATSWSILMLTQAWMAAVGELTHVHKQ